MSEILNTWKSDNIKLVYFNEGSPVYKVGDYAIYKQGERCYLYTFRNIAINQLAGLNKEHLNQLASGVTQPENNFLYHRAIESLKRGEQLLNN